MVTIKQLSNEIKSILKNGGIDDYIFESRCIIETIMHLSHSQLVANQLREVTDQQYASAIKSAEKRITGFPLQYILGCWEFYGFEFYVGDGVLIPRQDTETLVDYVLNYCNTINNQSKLKCIDLCSGSGCIAISLSLNLSHADFTAIELSDKAFNYLKRNTDHNKVANLHLLKGDVLDACLSNTFKNIDIIVSNPPYLTQEDMNSLQKEVTFEPTMALNGGNDGLLFYSSIVKLWKHSLNPGGLLAFEIGIGQENNVAAILKSNGFTNITFTRDLSSIIRVVSANYQPDTI